ncbi:MAG: DUF3047 domain-containing protein [Thermodesulfobacteriota bacterium]
MGAEELYIIDLFSDRKTSNGLPIGWNELFFKKISAHTEYTVAKEGDNYFIKAVSNSSASGIYKDIRLDPKEYQIIRWKWRVENTLTKGDATKKSGDDYPARIYITFQYDPETTGFWERGKYEAYKLIYGEYPPKGAINYIWANRLPKGTSIDNAYVSKAKMIAVESGGSKVGNWITEERNLYEDYKMLFGEEPSLIKAIAIMTDTDNTGESAVAYYDDIVLLKRQDVSRYK